MIAQLFYSLFAWLPAPLETICVGIAFIFFLITVLHIIRFVFDLIPFL